MTVDFVVNVAVDKAAFHFDRLFSYRVPSGLAQNLACGCRVLVPFGASNRKRQGMVLGMERQQPEGEALQSMKPIAAVLDEQPVLSQEGIELVRYLKATTFCTYYEAVKTLLPAALNYEVERLEEYNPEFTREELLSPEETRILDTLRRSRKGLERQKLCEIFGLRLTAPVFTHLLELGAIRESDTARRRLQDETITMVRLAEDLDVSQAMSTCRTQNQRSVLELLEQVGDASLKEVSYFTSVTRSVLDNLRKKGWVEYYERKAPLRSGTEELPEALREETVLNEEQKAAYEGLSRQYSNRAQGNSTALLFGITGSGKTQVFLKLIDDVVADGRQVIVMVPEIALTPQTIRRFQSYFGSRVAVIHSGLSLTERYTQHRRIAAGEVSIAVGTRSAVFAPFQRLGLVILDEEQEGSYKSDRSPRYHARDVAKFRCRRHGAMLLLASATPSVESYYEAARGKYSLYTLNRRFGAAKLPGVGIVDMKEERMEGNLSPLSRVLAEEVQQNLQRGEQTILLLNRRGFNTVVQCTQCGEAANCPNCSIAMTYHRANNRLMCHYCGYSTPLISTCQKCGSKMIRYDGIGTQRLQEAVQAMFPAARVLRMDTDSTMSKNAYEQSFSRFAAGEYDILVGTQMVAKGLNFPNVTLVGVLSADSAVHADNYKSAERTFSLITQVVGRCGRADKPGRAYIQSFQVDNPVLQLAARQDYESFFKEEIRYRKMMLYPPFCDVCVIGFSGIEERAVKLAAQSFAGRFSRTAAASYPQLPLRLLGPVPSGILKVSNKYRYKLLLKCRNSAKLRQLLQEVLLAQAQDKGIRGVSSYVDFHFDGVI